MSNNSFGASVKASLEKIEIKKKCCKREFADVKRCLDNEGNLDTENGNNIFCYTFGGIIDRSIQQHEYYGNKVFSNNIISTPQYTGCDGYILPNNVFLSIDSCVSYGNTLGINCTNNTFGSACKNNTLGEQCVANTFENECESNTLADNCAHNEFGIRCVDNTFDSGCSVNKIATYC